MASLLAGALCLLSRRALLRGTVLAAHFMLPRHGTSTPVHRGAAGLTISMLPMVVHGVHPTQVHLDVLDNKFANRGHLRRHVRSRGVELRRRGLAVHAGLDVMQQLHEFRFLLQVQRSQTAETVRDQLPIFRRRFGRDSQGDLSRPLAVVLALLVVEPLDRLQRRSGGPPRSMFSGNRLACGTLTLALRSTVWFGKERSGPWRIWFFRG